MLKLYNVTIHIIGVWYVPPSDSLRVESVFYIISKILDIQQLYTLVIRAM